MEGKDLTTIAKTLAAFAREREWEKCHSPKNLAMALSVESAELLDHFQWITENESRQLKPAKIIEIGEEAADVQIYLLILADKLGIDLIGAVEAKIEKNRSKYPPDEVRGSAARSRHAGPQ